MATATTPMAAAFRADDEEFLGLVKSYNERRGFGFVASERTAYKFGRDVYIAKAEARMAHEDGTYPAQQIQRPGQPKQQGPCLAEEDVIRFRVRFSADGMPQAEKIRRVRKFTGVISVAPDTANEESIGRITSDELQAKFGAREALLRRFRCGQARFSPGDRVTFAVDGWGPNGELEALLVLLVPRNMPILDHVLGCFGLALPRQPMVDGWMGRPPLCLDCHALADRIILAGLPPDANETELMGFFSKHGATGVAMARSQTCTFASVGFPGTAEIVRFVGRGVHTFSDDKDKETRLVLLKPCSKAGGCKGSLPGLPAPVLMPAEETGSLVVRWSPIVLATGYNVELRPAGTQAQWSPIDAPGGSFSKHTASCRVSGLPSSVAFEARITYLTSCGCCSDPSDASAWCMAMPTVGPVAGLQAAMHWGMPQAMQTMAPQLPPQAPTILATPQPTQNAWDGSWQTQVAFPMPPQQPPIVPPGAGWRCQHGAVNPPPSKPELRAVDDAGYALVVQWPSVAQATAYVVELREPGALRAERFVRSVPMQVPGALVELQVGGLRPSGPGSVYVAQVRSVSACGCESEPSAAATLTVCPVCPVTTQHSPTKEGLPISLAEACSPPAAVQHHSPQGFGCEEVPEKTGAKLSPHSTPPSVPRGVHHGELPGLLGRHQNVSSPTGPTTTPSFHLQGDPVKDFAPEVAGHESRSGDEECIILD